MGVQFDLVIPPIIVGILILLIFRINSFMMDSSVDNRLSYEMQNFAEASMTLLQHELRSVDDIFTCENSLCHFKSINGDTVKIFQSGRDIKVVRYPFNSGSTDSISHSARLSSLDFDWFEPTRLKVKLVTESKAEQEIGADDGNRIKGFAEKQFFLRNLAY